MQCQGKRLLLHPAQGLAVTLKPVPSPHGPEGNDNAYYYWGSLPQVYQWVVDVVTDEGPAVLLVDQRTGRRTTLLGTPISRIKDLSYGHSQADSLRRAADVLALSDALDVKRGAVLEVSDASSPESSKTNG